VGKRITSRRGKAKTGTARLNSWGWSGKALGLVVCAFFVFGMATGLSRAGRALAARARVTLTSYWGEVSGTFAQWRGHAARSAMFTPIPRRAPSGDVAALVERRDGFYELYAGGELHGPVQLARVGDVPILSGARIQNAAAEDLVQYASVLVRSEAILSGLVSEMRLDEDGTASLFLDRSHTELRVDLDNASAQLRRAAQVLGQWRGRQQSISMIDMTVPGEAVMRFRGVTRIAAAQSPGGVRPVAQRTRSGVRLRAGGGGRR
jgi:hypothetical protein